MPEGKQGSYSRGEASWAAWPPLAEPFLAQ